MASRPLHTRKARSVAIEATEKAVRSASRKPGGGVVRADAGGMRSAPDAAADDSALKLWVVLARAFDAVERHSAADIARHGLTTGEFAILEALYHKGPILLGELQRRVLVSSGGTTFLVNRLVERGLVVREACASDRRASYAVLTHAGRRLIARIFPEHAACMARAVSGLAPAERAAATNLLRTLGLAAAESLRADSGRPARSRKR